MRGQGPLRSRWLAGTDRGRIREMPSSGSFDATMGGSSYALVQKETFPVSAACSGAALVFNREGEAFRWTRRESGQPARHSGYCSTTATDAYPSVLKTGEWTAAAVNFAPKRLPNPTHKSFVSHGSGLVIV